MNDNSKFLLKKNVNKAINFVDKRQKKIIIRGIIGVPITKLQLNKLQIPKVVSHDETSLCINEKMLNIIEPLLHL